LETGPGVKYIKAGDKVVLHWRKGEGIQSEPPKYEWKNNVLNAGWVTTFNSHAIVSENRCTKIDDEINPDLASLFGCAITTGFGVVENNAKLKMGQSVVVLGAGGVGLNIIQACFLRSAYPIIAVDLFDSKLSLAKSLGATHLINSKNQNFAEEVRKIIGGNNLDVFIDNTGITSIIEKGYEILNSQGKMILVGVPRQGQNINIFTLPLHFGKTITGSHGGESNPHNDIPRYCKLFKENIAYFEKLISRRYKLENINDAIHEMKLGTTPGRILIDM
jgi:Zn-dependent alcohol dehydrogenase